MQEVQDPQNRLPPELMRRYDVVFVPRSLQKPLKLREIGSKNVGRLVTVQVRWDSKLARANLKLLSQLGTAALLCYVDMAMHKLLLPSPSMERSVDL